MKVAFVGSRKFPDLALVEWYVSLLPAGTVVVSGGAPGVDYVAVDFARKLGLEAVVFPADWERHGKKVGFLRNIQIIQAADRVMAFWDGQSKGTKHSIELAKKAGKQVEIILPPNRASRY